MVGDEETQGAEFMVSPSSRYIVGDDLYAFRIVFNFRVGWNLPEVDFSMNVCIHGQTCPVDVGNRVAPVKFSIGK